MQKVDGEYADETMRLVIVPTEIPTRETMEAGEEAAETLIEGNTCTVVEDGESMTPESNGSCFELHVGVGDDSEFIIDTTGMTGFAIYAQHSPREFERDKHYLY
ncbi:hypothetical protein TrRE_jg6953, partial [Triparma retinervis]